MLVTGVAPEIKQEVLLLEAVIAIEEVIVVPTTKRDQIQALEIINTIEVIIGLLSNNC